MLLRVLQILTLLQRPGAAAGPFVWGLIELRTADGVYLVTHDGNYLGTKA